jgi:hypothetical protein
MSMESKHPAPRGLAATTELWGAVYLMLFFTLAARAFHAWQKLDGKPIGWQDVIPIAIDLLISPAPLLMGFSFQHWLKREVDRSQLSPRTYRICSFWIAQLLVLAYITMVL